MLVNWIVVRRPFSQGRLLRSVGSLRIAGPFEAPCFRRRPGFGATSSGARPTQANNKQLDRWLCMAQTRWSSDWGICEGVSAWPAAHHARVLAGGPRGVALAGLRIVLYRKEGFVGVLLRSSLELDGGRGESWPNFVRWRSRPPASFSMMSMWSGCLLEPGPRTFP